MSSNQQGPPSFPFASGQPLTSNKGGQLLNQSANSGNAIKQGAFQPKNISR